MLAKPALPGVLHRKAVGRPCVLAVSYYTGSTSVHLDAVPAGQRLPVEPERAARRLTRSLANRAAPVPGQVSTVKPREVDMSRMSLTALLIIAVAAVTSACGQQHVGGGPSAGSGSAPSGSP